MAHKIRTEFDQENNPVVTKPLSRRDRRIATRDFVPPDSALQPGDFRAILRGRWREQPSTCERNETMGYLIRPVAAAAPAPVEVPDEIAAELEELFGYLTKNPDQIAFVEFSDETTGEGDDAKTITGAAQRDAFVKRARSWANLRTVKEGEGDDAKDVPAPLVFRQLRSNNLPDNQLRFNLTLPLTPEQEEEARTKREADKKRRAEAKAKKEAEATAAAAPTAPKPGAKK